MTDSLGSASGSIELDASGALRALDQVGAGVNKMAADSARNMQVVGQSLLGIGTVMLGAFGLATTTAIGFEAQMSAVGSVAGASKDELAALSDEALRLGSSTSFGASEAASAMETFMKAGGSLEDVLDGATESVLNLSAATGADVTLSAETAATAMTVFGVSAEEAANIIAQSANASSLDVNDWALALKSVGPVADVLGISMQDLSNAMVILGDAGIKGEVAATALRNILTGLADPANEGRLALEEMGIAVVDSQGSFRGLEAITHDLAGSWGEMDAAQQLQLATMIAGEQGAAAFIATMNAQTEAVNNNSDAFDEAEDRQAATGTAAEQAAARIDNFKGSWDRLMGVLETISIVALSRLLPAFRSVVDVVANLAAKFLDLPAGVQTAIAAFVGIAGALLTVAGGFLLMLPRIRETIAAFRALGLGIGILTSPIALVVLAIAALAVGAVLLYKHWKPFRDLVDKTAAALRKFAATKVLPFLLAIADAVGRLSKAFDFYSDRTDIVSAALKSLAAVFPGLRGVIEPIIGFIDRLKGAWRSLEGEGLNPVERALRALGQVFPLLSGFLGQIEAAINPLIESFQHLWDAVQQIFDGDWGGALGSLAQAFLSFGEAVARMMLALPNLILDVFRAIDWGDVASGVASGIASVISSIWNAIQGIDWGGLLAKGWEIIQGLWQSLEDNWPTISGWLLGLAGRVALAVQDAGSWLATKGQQIISGLWAGILEGWDILAGWVKTNISKSTFSGWISYVWDWLKEKGQAIIDSLKTGIQFGWDTLRDWVKTTITGSTITGWIGIVTTWLQDKGKALIGGFLLAIVQKWEDVKTWFAGLADSLNLDALAGAFDVVIDAVESVIGFLGDAYDAAQKFFHLFGGGDSSSGGGLQGDPFAVPGSPQSGTGNNDPRQWEDTHPESAPQGELPEAVPPPAGQSGFGGAAALGAMAAVVAAMKLVQLQAGLTGTAVKQLATDTTAGFVGIATGATVNLLPVGALLTAAAVTWPAGPTAAANQIRSAMQANFASAQADTASKFAAIQADVGAKTELTRAVAVKSMVALQVGMSASAKQAQSDTSAQMSLAHANTASNLDRMRMAAGVAMSSLRSIMASGASQAAAAVANGLAIIPGIVRSIGNQAASVGRGVGANIGNSIALGMLGALGAVRAAAAALVAAAQTALVAKAIIGSPSKLFMRLGRYTGEGYVLGIRDMVSEAARAAADLVSPPALSPYALGYGATSPLPAYALAGNTSTVINTTYVNNIESIDVRGAKELLEFGEFVTGLDRDHEIVFGPGGR